MQRTVIAGLALLAAAACETETSVTSKAFDTEAHLYLEEVEGEDALTWVRTQNDRTLGLLQADARYEGYYNAALDIATSQDRIPYGAVRKGHVYNFWQDATHERGVWRRTTPASYATAAPEWETLLDFDALAAAEGANWVYKGANCLPPDYQRCLISLSDGGKDAVRVREYDIGPKAFVSTGFDLPEAKTGSVWQDADTLLVATDWGATGETLTESGYPFVVKRLARGQALADAAEVFSGAKTDVGVFPMSMEDEAGRRWFGATRAETFFTSSHYIFPDGAAPLKLPLPPKATPQGLYAGQLLVTLEQDWTPDGQNQDEGAFQAGDLIAFAWDAFLADGALPKVDLVFRPTGKQALQGVSIAKGALLLNISDNVVVKVMRYARAAEGWTSTEIALPANGSASVVFADEGESSVFLGYENFLQPDALYSYDTVSGALAQIKSLPAWFNADPYVTEQFEATSTDGVKVPYFVVRRKDAPLDGSNPALLYAYGGFQVSYPPYYSGTTGRLWLEQGGVYVLANIRGGGEFGPAWHQAGLKTKRRVVYDDFIAVSEDIIARRITSNTKLGIMGGSNGGLLMGVMFTQRPDLFAAIVCQVPLLDMLRYHLLLAGASWMDEYGDPDVAEERTFLEATSPYHNIDPAKTYPEIYFETSTKDDRVHPAHARKMAKRLEDLGMPFLYYENIDGGHSAAANQRETARRSALEYTYLARKLMDGK